MTFSKQTPPPKKWFKTYLCTTVRLTYCIFVFHFPPIDGPWRRKSNFSLWLGSLSHFIREDFNHFTKIACDLVYGLRSPRVYGLRSPLSPWQQINCIALKCASNSHNTLQLGGIVPPYSQTCFHLPVLRPIWLPFSTKKAVTTAPFSLTSCIWGRASRGNACMKWRVPLRGASQHHGHPCEVFLWREYVLRPHGHHRAHSLDNTVLMWGGHSS